jgi:hypothetical protein
VPSQICASTCSPCRITERQVMPAAGRGVALGDELAALTCHRRSDREGQVPHTVSRP